jgi:hypothetical protein
MPVIAPQITNYGPGPENELYARKYNPVFSGDLTVTGEIEMTTDISNNTGLVHYNVDASDYPLYPSFVKITTAGSITKQGSATEITESQFVIPLDGYYSYTAQIILGTVGTVADGDILTLFGDISGGSLTPINGTTNIIDVAENSSNAIQIAVSGLIYDKLTAGQVIRFFHSEAGTYTFSTGSVQVAYKYEGNKAL